MNSVVCISQVPDTESRIKIAGDGRRIDETGLKFIVSPYDEFALEEAIRLKEAKGASYHDLTPHPWAGLPVEIRLRATDAAGAYSQVIATAPPRAGSTCR